MRNLVHGEMGKLRMRHFGAFLSNLRNSVDLSLEELAILVGTSRSTISRIENNDVPQPFKGSVRKLLICIAEILCISQPETEKYLSLAGLEQALLAEVEAIQLGFSPHIAKGSSEEGTELERIENIYEQLLKNLEKREREADNPPPNLRLKIQKYSNILQEIRHRLDRLYNRFDSMKAEPTLIAHVYYTEKIGERIVIGDHYGANWTEALKATNLFSLASDNARWLMQRADIENFAVDDCIILANSENFRGWESHEIRTTILNSPLPIPDDLITLCQEKLPSIEKHYFNAPHYRLVSATPAFSELDHLKILIAPIGFYEYFSLNPYFDELLLTSLDGSKTTIREKYGNTALIYSSTDKGMSLIPAPISIQCIILTVDKKIILMQRSRSVAFYPDHWSASFEETMNAPIVNQGERFQQKGDRDFFAGAIRGLEEEFALEESAIEHMKALSLNVEYLTLSVDVIILIHIKLSADEIKQNWLLKAPHKAEASRFETISNDLASVKEKLLSRTLWHPTSRMRLIQFLFHTYGIDTVVKAFKE